MSSTAVGVVTSREVLPLGGEGSGVGLSGWDPGQIYKTTRWTLARASRVSRPDSRNRKDVVKVSGLDAKERPGVTIVGIILDFIIDENNNVRLNRLNVNMKEIIV